VVRPPSASAHDGFASVSIDEGNTMMMDCAMTSAQSTLPAFLAQRGWVRHVAESAHADAVFEIRRLVLRRA
jgi:hypothetical protein